MLIELEVQIFLESSMPRSLNVLELLTIFYDLLGFYRIWF